MRQLWEDFFPNKNTRAEDIPRVVANRDWVRDCLVYYGWEPLNIDMRYIDGGAVLYIDGYTLCALLSADMSGPESKLKITYVDNRA